MTVRAYARVSTNEQAQSGLGIEAQLHTIDRWVGTHGTENPEPVLYVDDGRSGSTLDRPELQRLLSEARRGDKVVVARLDRLSRSLLDFAGLLQRSQREGWGLVCIDLGVDMSTPTGRLVAGVVATVAEFERSVIGERTSEAMAAARRRGRLPGRRSRVPSEIQDRLVALRETMTLQQIADTLNDEGVKTSTGREWSTSSVHSALRSARLEADARECLVVSA